MYKRLAALLHCPNLQWPRSSRLIGWLLLLYPLAGSSPHGHPAISNPADRLTDKKNYYPSAYHHNRDTPYSGSIRAITHISQALSGTHRWLVASRMALYLAHDTLMRQSYPPFQAPLPLALTDNDQATIQVALTNCADPKNAYLRYRLQGLADTTWHRPDSLHTVCLFDLPVGDYTLQVKAESAAGHLVTNTLSFPLKIRRTWWKHPAVWSLTALVVLAATYLKSSRWLRKQQYLKLRRQLAYDLHDEVGSLLVRVSLQIQLLKDEDALPGFTANNLLGELQGVSQAISDIVWGIDTYNDTLGSLLDRMREHLAKVAGTVTRPIRFQAVGIHQDQVVTQMLRQHLYFIFKEALTNSLRHAQPSTLISVSFTQQGSQLILRVANDGQSQPLAHRQGVGLRSMQQRSQAINGQLEAAAQPGGGFLVVLRVHAAPWLAQLI